MVVEVEVYRTWVQVALVQEMVDLAAAECMEPTLLLRLAPRVWAPLIKVILVGTTIPLR